MEEMVREVLKKESVLDQLGYAGDALQGVVSVGGAIAEVRALSPVFFDQLKLYL